MQRVLRIKQRSGTEDIPLPRYQTEHSAGLDLHAANEKPIRVEPGDVRLVPTGLFVEIPTGCEGQVRARSGLALKLGLMLPNAPGTIDADYRGELQVIVGNCSRKAFTIERGTRFAQLVIARFERVEVNAVPELSKTPRGTGGFGHTGS